MSQLAPVHSACPQVRSGRGSGATAPDAPTDPCNSSSSTRSGVKRPNGGTRAELPGSDAAGRRAAPWDRVSWGEGVTLVSYNATPMLHDYRGIVLAIAACPKAAEFTSTSSDSELTLIVGIGHCSPKHVVKATSCIS